MPRRDWRAISAFVRLGWQQAVAQRATLVGRILSVWLILFIFWALWKVTPLGELGSEALTVEQLLWYLAATETVVIGVGAPYRSVEIDVLNGELANSLTRPLGYAVAVMATWLGEAAYRFIAIGTAALGCALLTTRTLPVGFGAFVLLVLGLWLGCVMVLLCQLAIGFVTIWMKSAAPTFWVWQKLLFVLGGLMIPLSLYPGWLMTLAKATPFAAMLFLPASLLFGMSVAQTLELFIWQAGWLIALVGLVGWLQHRAQAHITRYGA